MDINNDVPSTKVGYTNLAIKIGFDRGRIEVLGFPTLDQANKFKANTKIPNGGMILVTQGDKQLRHVASSFLAELHSILFPGMIIPSKKSKVVSAIYDGLMGVSVEQRTVKDGDITKTKKANTPRAKKSTTPQDCFCGCGTKTSGGMFAPGHDGRVAGWIKRIDAGSMKAPNVLFQTMVALWQESGKPKHLSVKDLIERAKSKV
jgi:hypothetical protein